VHGHEPSGQVKYEINGKGVHLGYGIRKYAFSVIRDFSKMPLFSACYSFQISKAILVHGSPTEFRPPERAHTGASREHTVSNGKCTV
jgi:hypothetical protein